MKVKYKKSNIYLFICMTLMHNFFYLIPANIGPIGYYDFIFLLISILVFYAFVIDKNHFISGHFSKTIISIPILVLLSSIAAYYNYGQGIISGVLTQRAWIVTGLLYFSLYVFIRKRKLDYDDFYSVLKVIVCIELILYYTQYLLGSSNMFLNVMYYYRYGQLRLYFNTNYFFLFSLLATERILMNLRKKILIKEVLLIALIVSFYIIVSKGRFATVSLLLGIALVLILNHNVPKHYKYGIIILSMILVYCFILNTTLIQDAISLISKQSDDSGKIIRIMSRSYYFDKWCTNPISFILGYGYANSNISESVRATGVLEGYLYADNGIFSFISCYGLIGLVWYICCQIKLFRYGLMFWKKSLNTVLAKTIIGIITITTSVGYYYSFYSFDLVLFMILIELYYVQNINH